MPSLAGDYAAKAALAFSTTLGGRGCLAASAMYVLTRAMSGLTSVCLVFIVWHSFADALEQILHEKRIELTLSEIKA